MKKHILSATTLSLAIVCACSAAGDGDDGARNPGQTTSGPSARSGPNATAGTGGGAFGNSGFTPTVPQQPPVVTPAMATTPMATNIQPVSIDACGADNPAGVSAEDAQQLVAGGGGPGALRVLYPYAGTVFPRGMLAPLLMWDGAAMNARAVYVHLKSSLFEYRGCLTPSGAGQVTLPQEVWTVAGTQSLGAQDPFTLELSALDAGTVIGPVAQSLTIAQATIKGSIYYNSYSSKLGTGTAAAPAPAPVPGLGGVGGNGIVLRIQPGGEAEAFASMECTGCHSVSANGSRLLSAALTTGSQSFVLTPGGAPNPASVSAGPKGAFGALFPDGSVYLAMSTATNVGRVPFVSSLDAPVDATLYRTDDGSVVPNTGIPPGALMPTFSASGRVLAFTDNAIGGPLGSGSGIAVMDFDVSTHTATHYRELFTDPEYRPGWPFTLPDDRAVVFTRTDGLDFSGDGAGLFPGVAGPVSDLYLGDVASGTVTVLAQAMGYATPQDAESDTTYLPFGAADLHGNYFPTVSPVAAGGYFWIFFDSLRNYGNLGVQRQLWGAAIDVLPDGSYVRDPSHPPFYLPGQEFGTGNHRAFAALDPCKQDGESCSSGTDCCGGYCSLPDPPAPGGAESQGTCGSVPPECAHLDERCESAADCCPSPPDEPQVLCIGGFCAVPVVL